MFKIVFTWSISPDENNNIGQVLVVYYLGHLMLFIAHAQSNHLNMHGQSFVIFSFAKIESQLFRPWVVLGTGGSRFGRFWFVRFDHELFRLWVVSANLNINALFFVT